VLFTSGGALFVERSVIDGWDRGIDFAGDGDLFVRDTTVRNSGSAGLRVAPSTVARASVDRSRFEGTAGGCGVDVFAGASVSVRGSVASGNVSGFCASVGSETSVSGSAASHNSTAGISVSGGTARIMRSLVVGNGTGLSNSGGTIESLVNTLVRGNGTDTVGAITPIAGH
jgi:Right handed beta helix region